MISEIEKAFEMARYPERFTRDGQRLALKATNYRPARAASWQQPARAPHTSEETRLAAMLHVLNTLKETELAAMKQIIEVASAAKAEKDGAK